MTERLSYQQAGVDIAKAEAFVERIAALPKTTELFGEVVPFTGAYAGLFRPRGFSAMQDPLLVSATDGVGTKLLIAREAGLFAGLGQDLVAMSVNDLLPSGARPLFFLDYIATGKLDVEQMTQIVSGIAKACSDVGCVLLGGETAEMPGLYATGDFDLAGFVVGMVDGAQLPKHDLTAGDFVVALPSSGIHANGLSLARKALFDKSQMRLDTQFGAHTLAQELLVPTALYVNTVLQIRERYAFKAAAHITGGGLLGRLDKLSRENYRVIIDPKTYAIPEIFALIQQAGDIESSEMARTFNMGLGFVMVMEPNMAKAALQNFPTLLHVGEIASGARGVDLGYAQT
jgi:phosphoribosylformylglycinamidine cyclo-ligase